MSVSRDQDSNASLESDVDDEMSGADEEIEDCVEYIKGSTHEAEDKMKTCNIPCWIETRRELKWRIATRLATQSEDRWTRRVATWNPSLSSSTKTTRSIGRPRKDGKMTSMN